MRDMNARKNVVRVDKSTSGVNKNRRTLASAAAVGEGVLGCDLGLLKKPLKRGQ